MINAKRSMCPPDLQPCPLLQVVLDRIDKMEENFDDKMSQLLEARVAAAAQFGTASEKLVTIEKRLDTHDKWVYGTAMGIVAVIGKFLIEYFWRKG